MLYDLKNEYDVPKFKERVNALLERKAVVELTEVRRNRTLSQNSYLHLILSWFALETGYGLEEVKLEFFKKTCNHDLFFEEVVNKRGVLIRHYRSSRSLDTDEMTKAIDRFRNWSASNGIYLPSPMEHEALLHVKNEVERNKEYL